MKDQLPPIPEESLDGDKEKIELTTAKCSHKQVKYRNNELRCVCGAAWSGPGLDRLYKLLISQTT